MVWLQLLVFPQSSVAFQVWVKVVCVLLTTYAPTLAGVNVPLQASLAEGATNVMLASQATEIEAGQVITGAVLSSIVNVADIVAVLPQASIALKITEALPVAPHRLMMYSYCSK